MARFAHLASCREGQPRVAYLQAAASLHRHRTNLATLLDPGHHLLPPLKLLVGDVEAERAQEGCIDGVRVCCSKSAFVCAKKTNALPPRQRNALS